MHSIQYNKIKILQHNSWLVQTAIFAANNQQDATFRNSFISVRRSTCFRRFFRPSSGAQNCTYSVRYLSDKYLTLYVQFWAPDDGRKTRLKHVKRLTEINKLWNVASCWLYSANILAMYGPMNVKFAKCYTFRQRNAVCRESTKIKCR